MKYTALLLSCVLLSVSGVSSAYAEDALCVPEKVGNGSANISSEVTSVANVNAELAKYEAALVKAAGEAGVEKFTLNQKSYNIYGRGSDATGVPFKDFYLMSLRYDFDFSPADAAPKLLEAMSNNQIVGDISVEETLCP